MNVKKLTDNILTDTTVYDKKTRMGIITVNILTDITVWKCKRHLFSFFFFFLTAAFID